MAAMGWHNARLDHVLLITRLQIEGQSSEYCPDCRHLETFGDGHLDMSLLGDIWHMLFKDLMSSANVPSFSLLLF